MIRNFLRVAGAGLVIAMIACGGDEPTSPAQPSPTVSAVSPTKGTVGTELTINGTNFRSGASVNVGSLAASGVEVANATTIYATVPAGVTGGQVYAVGVRNSDGTTAQLAGGFTAVAPTLSYVNGATMPSGNTGSTVILEGAAFGDVQGTSQVLFSNGTGGTVAATIASAADWTDASSSRPSLQARRRES